MEKEKYTTEWLQTAEELLRHIKAFGFTPEKLLDAENILHPRQGNIVQGETENARSDEPSQPVLIKDPDGTLNDTKRFMWELGNAILHRHHKALNLHNLREAVDWIFAAEHKQEDQFYRECLIAEELRNGGRKRKSADTMYMYARQGGMSSPSVAKRIARSRQEARREAYRKELAELAKLDPVHIY